MCLKAVIPVHFSSSSALVVHRAHPGILLLLTDFLPLSPCITALTVLALDGSLQQRPIHPLTAADTLRYPDI